MKVLKAKTQKVNLNDKWKVGNRIEWTVGQFDGRTTEYVRYEGTVVKVNRVTLDVKCDKPQMTVRLDLDDLMNARNAD